MAEITVNGYIVKNANDWFLEEQQMYLAIDSEWNLDPSVLDGLKLASDSEIWATLDEIGLKAYNSKDPNKAVDSELDILLYLTTGKTRSLGTPSSVPISIGGAEGLLITAGHRMESVDTGYRWTIDSDLTIVGGVASGTATNVNPGVLEASIGTITTIVDPVSGWQSVTNTAIATPGTNRQSNSEVRTQRNRSVAKPGQNQIDTMISELLTTENVVDAVVPENDTGTDNFYGNGLPANSIAIIVDGGADAEVATTIYHDKSPGVFLHPANAPVVVEVTSMTTGNKKDITFSRPDFIDMIIVVTLVDDGSLPGNIEDLVADAIIKYAGGDLETQGQFRAEGFRIGDDVSSGQLFTPTNSVVGQYGNSYTSNISVNGGAVKAIAFNEKSRFTAGNITVTII